MHSHLISNLVNSRCWASEALRAAPVSKEPNSYENYKINSGSVNRVKKNRYSFHKVERFVKTCAMRQPPDPFQAGLKGEKEI